MGEKNYAYIRVHKIFTKQLESRFKDREFFNIMHIPKGTIVNGQDLSGGIINPLLMYEDKFNRNLMVAQYDKDYLKDNKIQVNMIENHEKVKYKVDIDELCEKIKEVNEAYLTARKEEEKQLKKMELEEEIDRMNFDEVPEVNAEKNKEIKKNYTAKPRKEIRESVVNGKGTVQDYWLIYSNNIDERLTNEIITSDNAKYLIEIDENNRNVDFETIPTEEQIAKGDTLVIGDKTVKLCHVVNDVIVDEATLKLGATLMMPVNDKYVLTEEFAELENIFNEDRKFIKEALTRMGEECHVTEEYFIPGTKGKLDFVGIDDSDATRVNSFYRQSGRKHEVVGIELSQNKDVYELKTVTEDGKDWTTGIYGKCTFEEAVSFEPIEKEKTFAGSEEVKTDIVF